MLSSFRLERKQKNYSHPFRVRIFLFVSYSFGTETVNTFIHSVVPATQIMFQTKMGKVYTRLQTKTAQKPLPDGEAHTCMAYIWGVPPGAWLRGNDPRSSTNTKWPLYWADFPSLWLKKWVNTPHKGDIEALAKNLNLHSINEQTH